jgi:phosphonopyruvate decarboxylase
VLLIVTWRGEPGGKPDEPQHGLMGPITPGLFDLMGIPWEPFPDTVEAVGPALARAVAHMDATGTPYGLLMSAGAVAEHALRSSPTPRPLVAPPGLAAWPAERPTRREALAAVQQAARPSDALLATTGYTGRALYALDDRPSQLYMVGAMGCVSSLALGLALAEPWRRVIALDGDGALLMRLGGMTTIGYERPANLIHVVLDNEVHDSTGGQATVSHSVDLAAMAAASGYQRIMRAGSARELAEAIADLAPGLAFVHVKTAPGEAADLPRPTVPPADVAVRFGAWLAASRPAALQEIAR